MLHCRTEKVVLWGSVKSHVLRLSSWQKDSEYETLSESSDGFKYFWAVSHVLLVDFLCIYTISYHYIYFCSLVCCSVSLRSSVSVFTFLSSHSRSWQMAAHHTALFCWRSLSVKTEFYLLIMAKCLFIGIIGLLEFSCLKYKAAGDDCCCNLVLY